MKFTLLLSTYLASTSIVREAFKNDLPKTYGKSGTFFMSLK